MNVATKKIGVFLTYAVFGLILLTPTLVLAQTPPTTNTNTAQPAATPSTAQTPSQAATQAVTQGVAAGAQPSNAGVLPTSDTLFVPLTQLPGIREAAAATSFPNFLNTLYKICLGAGAAIAVIMIMVAGVQYMTSSGSVSGNSKAKERIQNALLGLLLVLAPTIVFGIINPSILSLDFANKFTGLQGATPTAPSGSAATGEDLSGVPRDAIGPFTGADLYLWVDLNNFTGDDLRCQNQAGTLEYSCGVLSDGSGGHTVAANQACSSGETRATICRAPSTAANTQARCLRYAAPGITVPLHSSAAACSPGYMAIPHGCCAGSAPTGNLCCVQTGLPTAAGVQQYQVSAYYTVHNVASNRTCYRSISGQFTTVDECNSTLAAYRQEASSRSTREQTNSAVTVLKSCVVTTGPNYVVPAPNNIPQC